MGEESKLIKEFQKVISQQEGKFQKGENVDLSKANNYYNKLIKNGVIKRRGFTLRGIEDAHLFNVRLSRQ
ncbi:hypothetical protein [Chitinophaga sp. S165]|uniref:hypothetical protein n=1 Tax=Chitinophaga sp. S165 TaxID=2135462 RepID=UPI000D71715A|nr:hypothetical protein [Chitinophaga sp. S165]PWV53471.1 hypothetical protein C7475_102219 [Chitinophaga sp. S165]